MLEQESLRSLHRFESRAGRHGDLKEEIRVLTAEWEQLVVSAEQMKQKTQ
jgi:hypothetical protein